MQNAPAHPITIYDWQLTVEYIAHIYGNETNISKESVRGKEERKKKKPAEKSEKTRITACNPIRANQTYRAHTPADSIEDAICWFAHPSMLDKCDCTHGVQ